MCRVAVPRLPPPNSDMNMKLYVNVGRTRLLRELTTRQRRKYIVALTTPKHASLHSAQNVCANCLGRQLSMN